MRNDTYDIYIERAIHSDAWRLNIESRRYDVNLHYELNRMWGDPRQLERYVENLIGRQLRLWDEMRVSEGRAMAQALLPFWEREISRFMEGVEHQRRFYGHMEDAIRYGTNAPYIHFPSWDEIKTDPKAAKKARELLVSQLNKAQRESFEKNKSFDVAGKDGKTYRISSERSFNVKGPDGVKYCGQTVDTPIEDQMLAQKLLLENDPAKFFKNANKMGGGGTAREIEMLAYVGARRIAMWRNGAEPWVW